MENKFIQLDPIFLNNKKLNVEIIRSKNRNGYASVKDSGIVISIPFKIHGVKYNEMVSELYKKITKHVLSHPNRFIKNKIYFHDGDITCPMGIKLKISTRVLDIKRAKYILDTGSITILIPKSTNPLEYSKIVNKMTIKAVSSSMYAFVVGRLNVINNKFFNSKVSRLKIRLNKNIWGSISQDMQ